MSMRNQIEVMLQEINGFINKDKSVQQILSDYIGKKFILNIEDEEFYCFLISSENIKLEVLKELPTKIKDMYIKIDKDRLKKLIGRKRIRISDLPSIKHKNIKIKEIKLIKNFLPKDYI